jgi:hypothetical protein
MKPRIVKKWTIAQDSAAKLRLVRSMGTDSKYLPR